MSALSQASSSRFQESLKRFESSGDDLDGYFRSPEDYPLKWLLMLTAYVDESGHEGKGWMSLAGFLGNESNWNDFVPKWRSALGPQRKFLHMSSLRWNKDSTRRLLARLGPIPNDCKLEPVFTGVKYADYEDLVSGTPEMKALKGWLACLTPLVMQTLRGIPEDERLELVFEEQSEYAPYAELALRCFCILDKPWKRTKDGRAKLAKWSFVPKGSTLMSDPADYFAYALRELWTDPTSKRTDWCKPILNSNNKEGYGKILYRPEIRKIIRNTQTLNTLSLLSEKLKLLGVTVSEDAK